MKYGAERAMMLHPSGLYGQFTTGSGRIDARLAQGWTIIPCPRNHLTRESKEEKPAIIGLDPVKTETEEAVEFQQPANRRARRKALKNG